MYTQDIQYLHWQHTPNTLLPMYCLSSILSTHTGLSNIQYLHWQRTPTPEMNCCQCTVLSIQGTHTHTNTRQDSFWRWINQNHSFSRKCLDWKNRLIFLGLKWLKLIPCCLNTMSYPVSPWIHTLHRTLNGATVSEFTGNKKVRPWLWPAESWDEINVFQTTLKHVRHYTGHRKARWTGVF